MESIFIRDVLTGLLPPMGSSTTNPTQGYHHHRQNFDDYHQNYNDHNANYDNPQITEVIKMMMMFSVLQRILRQFVSASNFWQFLARLWPFSGFPCCEKNIRCWIQPRQTLTNKKCDLICYFIPLSFKKMKSILDVPSLLTTQCTCII